MKRLLVLVGLVLLVALAVLLPLTFIRVWLFIGRNPSCHEAHCPFFGKCVCDDLPTVAPPGWDEPAAIGRSHLLCEGKVCRAWICDGRTCYAADNPMIQGNCVLWGTYTVNQPPEAMYKRCGTISYEDTRHAIRITDLTFSYDHPLSR